MRLAWILSLLFLGLPAIAHDSGVVSSKIAGHNETLDSSGVLKPAYRAFSARTGIPIFPVPAQAVQKLMGMPLGDAIKVLPIPAVLSRADYQKLQRGSVVRAQTLIAFFEDVIFNDSRKVRASGLLTDEQISHIFKTENAAYDIPNLRRLWSGRTKKDIGIIYGPDVIRTENGFRVLEDNLGGLIGGVGDLAAIHNAYFSAFGESPQLTPPLVPALELFLKDIPREKWSEEAVFLYRKQDEPSSSIKPEDDEDLRINEIAKNLKIKVIDAGSLKRESEDFKNLVEGKYKKVINLYSFYEVNGNYVCYALLEAFAQKKFDLFVGPGLDAVGSKAMLPFVDKMTELFLGKAPVELQTQPTFWVERPEEVDGLDANWVVKKADGRQGREVWMMDSINEAGRVNLKKNLEEWRAYLLINKHSEWPMFIRQLRAEPSFIPANPGESWIAFNVDFRPHVFVVGGRALKPAIWGRASWKIPGVLNNVSQTAVELVVTTPDLCERQLMRPAAK